MGQCKRIQIYSTHALLGNPETSYAQASLGRRVATPFSCLGLNLHETETDANLSDLNDDDAVRASVVVVGFQNQSMPENVPQRLSKVPTSLPLRAADLRQEVRDFPDQLQVAARWLFGGMLKTTDECFENGMEDVDRRCAPGMTVVWVSAVINGSVGLSLDVDVILRFGALRRRR